ncbi:MAG: inorganic pyrophosphatase [Leptospiraceae bacterium]|nr:inorganic pyrophosphatase [Leptospiraceae bacterium]MCP5513342.1 inorganic pyrophosphatase [Leptospiraceae bacterium]
MSKEYIKSVLHPWHGISPGENTPNELDAFIEMLPTDTVKYEIDKPSGYIRLDRPQKYSNHVPSLYGFIPQTYCGDNVAKFTMERTNKTDLKGDGDPLDICVITSSHISHGAILMTVVPIGGIRMIDKNEADDKIIAVLKGDTIFGHMKDIHHCSAELIDKLRHYFLTYKMMPDDEKRAVEITGVYGADEARTVIKHSLKDYEENFKK